MGRRVLCFFLGFVLLVTCSSIIPKLMQQDVVKGKSLYPDLTLEQLTTGRTVYINHCGSCHQLYIPTRVPQKKWDLHLVPMAKLSKLDSISTEKLTRYIRVAVYVDTTVVQN